MRRLFPVVAAVMVVLGCGEGESETRPVVAEVPRQDRVSIRPPALAPEIRALVDAGNTAFEGGDYTAALSSFEEAIAADSTSAPAWFGAYMTWAETGDTERAAAARARLTALARPAFGDPHAGDPAGGDEMVDETSELEGGT
ncbi:MAG TPA: hypothetical protein VJ925_01970 [Longimicrobiales bacterium]|nr:hypothetical protein [Longimicrobiales bacterium]